MNNQNDLALTVKSVQLPLSVLFNSQRSLRDLCELCKAAVILTAYLQNGAAFDKNNCPF